VCLLSSTVARMLESYRISFFIPTKNLIDLGVDMTSNEFSWWSQLQFLFAKINWGIFMFQRYRCSKLLSHRRPKNQSRRLRDQFIRVQSKRMSTLYHVFIYRKICFLKWSTEYFRKNTISTVILLYRFDGVPRKRWTAQRRRLSRNRYSYIISLRFVFPTVEHWNRN